MKLPPVASQALVLVRRYVLCVVDELSLAPFVGATLRGAVGRALRNLVCATKLPVCDGCSVRSACVYGMLHDGYTSAEGSAAVLHAPPPLWIRDVEPGKPMKSGDLVTFSMAAYGPAVRSLPFVDEAIVALRRRGLGRDRVGVELVEATDEFRGDFGSLVQQRIQSLQQDHPRCSSLRVHLVTPVAIRLKGAAWGDVNRPLPSWSERLAGGVARRRAALERRWLEVGAAELPRVREAVEDASDVTILETRVQPRDVRRYSVTEGRHVSFHGAVGSVLLGGTGLGRLLPWLAAGELLGVGSGTTFGFGRIALEACSA